MFTSKLQMNQYNASKASVHGVGEYVPMKRILKPWQFALLATFSPQDIYAATAINERLHRGPSPVELIDGLSQLSTWQLLKSPVIDMFGFAALQASAQAFGRATTAGSKVKAFFSTLLSMGAAFIGFLYRCAVFIPKMMEALLLCAEISLWQSNFNFYKGGVAGVFWIPTKAVLLVVVSLLHFAVRQIISPGAAANAFYEAAFAGVRALGGSENTAKWVGRFAMTVSYAASTAFWIFASPLIVAYAVKTLGVGGALAQAGSTIMSSPVGSVLSKIGSWFSNTFRPVTNGLSNAVTWMHNHTNPMNVPGIRKGYDKAVGWFDSAVKWCAKKSDVTHALAHSDGTSRESSAMMMGMLGNRGAAKVVEKTVVKASNWSAMRYFGHGQGVEPRDLTVAEQDQLLGLKRP
jgi:hypothetical protein